MIKESDAIEVLNLNTGTLNRLKNNGVFFIKDLLKLKYQDLFYMTKIGLKRATEIKDKLHEFGFYLKEEENDYKIKVDNLKNQGVILLENLNLNKRLCYVLYKNNIFTFEDLLNNIDKLKEINNLKDVGRTIILEFIKSIKYKEYLSLQEKENKIKNIAILTKTISLELEQDLLISKKELLLKELKEIILELESVLKEEQRERNRL